MNFHIHYLDTILVLLAIIFPSSYISIIPKKKNNQSSFVINNIIVYSILVAFLILVDKLGGINLKSPAYFYIVSIIAGFMCLAVEFYEGQLILYIKTKQFVKRIEVHKIYKDRGRIVDLLLIVIAAVLEELIFRQATVNIFMNVFRLNITIVIISSSVIYALNHIYFGVNSVVQKFLSGLILIALFYFSGYNILIPIIAHSSQNLILYFLANEGRWR